MNTNSDAPTIAGVINGKVTFQNTLNLLAPKIMMQPLLEKDQFYQWLPRPSYKSTHTSYKHEQLRFPTRRQSWNGTFLRPNKSLTKLGIKT